MFNYHLNKKFSASYFLLICVLCFFPAVNASTAKTSSTDVIYRLYKDFSWEAILASPEEAETILGGYIADQPKNILEKYFDSKLSSLLFTDSECVKNSGEVCKLDFDPIFASQDAGAHSLTIKAVDSNSVAVEFVYPSNNKKIRLEYKLKETANGWRINDIIYKNDNDLSLVNILK